MQPNIPFFLQKLFLPRLLMAFNMFSWTIDKNLRTGWIWMDVITQSNTEAQNLDKQTLKY